MEEIEYLNSILTPQQTKEFVTTALRSSAHAMNNDARKAMLYEQLGLRTVIDRYIHDSLSYDQIISEFGETGRGFIRVCLLHFSKLVASMDTLSSLNISNASRQAAASYLKMKNDAFLHDIQEKNIEVVQGESENDAQFPTEGEWDEIERNAFPEFFPDDPKDNG